MASRKYQTDSTLSKKTKEEIRITLKKLIKKSGKTQADIAEDCGWYISSTGKPDQAKVSSYVTGVKFSFPGLIRMLDKSFDMTLTQFFASATSDSSFTLEMTQMTKIMNELTPQQNEALVGVAKAMQTLVRKNQKLRGK